MEIFETLNLALAFRPNGFFPTSDAKSGNKLHFVTKSKDVILLKNLKLSWYIRGVMSHQTMRDSSVSSVPATALLFQSLSTPSFIPYLILSYFPVFLASMYLSHNRKKVSSSEPIITLGFVVIRGNILKALSPSSP